MPNYRGHIPYLYLVGRIVGMFIPTVGCWVHRNLTGLLCLEILAMAIWEAFRKPKETK